MKSTHKASTAAPKTVYAQIKLIFLLFIESLEAHRAFSSGGSLRVKNPRKELNDPFISIKTYKKEKCYKKVKKILELRYFFLNLGEICLGSLRIKGNFLTVVFFIAVHQGHQYENQYDYKNQENANHYNAIAPIDQRKNLLYHLQEFDLLIKNRARSL